MARPRKQHWTDYLKSLWPVAVTILGLAGAATAAFLNHETRLTKAETHLEMLPEMRQDIKTLLERK